VIYEKDISRVSGGQTVEFTTETGGRTYRATVHTTGKTIDPGNRSVDVHAHIDNPDDALLAGMYVRAGILTGSKKVTAIPEEGVVTEGGQDYVFLRRGNSFQRLAVGTGLRKDGYVEILSPETLPGDDLVTAGAYYLNAELSAGEE
jgi:cobalt-zinc-cadmium efflux system membrane fusion protein